MSATRRSVQLFTDGGVLPGKTSAHTLELVAGDTVRFSPKGDEIFVEEVLPRRNLFERMYREDRRPLAANLDHLFVLSAIKPAFQPFFIDRVLAVAHHQGIPCTLILNKQDLGTEAAEQYLETYRKLDLPILYVSAKFEQNLETVYSILANPLLGIVALTGVSGVGKSTLLNRLIPEAERKVGEMSRSGLGKQTTTQACAYLYPRQSSRRLFVIDLPGLQHFGVGHLSKEEVAASFPEFNLLAGRCKFDNCSHIKEQDCAVKAALETGEVSPARYDSYLRMIQEVEEAKPY